MKRLFLTLALALCGYYSYSQNIYTLDQTSANTANNGVVLSSVTMGKDGNNHTAWIQSYGATAPNPLQLNPLGGNVGIGTTTPQQKFVVSNAGAEGLEVYTNQPTGTIGLQVYNRSTNVYAPMAFSASNFIFAQGNALFGNTTSITTATPVNISLGGTYGSSSPGSLSNQKLKIWDNGTSAFGLGVSTNLLEIQANLSGAGIGFFVNGGTQAMNISSAGNISFGNTTSTSTATPLAVSLGGTYGTNAAGSISNQKLKIWDNGTYSYGFGVSNNLLEIQANMSASGIGFFVNGGTQAMNISSAGNVGIGTTTPDQKLSVNGAVHSKSVLVDLTGWPDYVFKKEYRLPSLTEVKTYIDQNHHLPDLPSEREVADKGLNLGEMVKLQTKKIEELTLYLIEKDKEITELKQQQADNKKQQQEIDQLKQQLEILIKEKRKD